MPAVLRYRVLCVLGCVNLLSAQYSYCALPYRAQKPCLSWSPSRTVVRVCVPCHNTVSCAQVPESFCYVCVRVPFFNTVSCTQVPESCCREDVSPTACATSREVTLLAGLTNTIYEDGCASKMMALIAKHDYIALAVVLAILLTEVMAMVFSMVLCCAVRRIDHFKA